MILDINRKLDRSTEQCQIKFENIEHAQQVNLKSRQYEELPTQQITPQVQQIHASDV